MDITTQILLTVMIVVLGITLTLIGVQLFFVLKELQKSIQKANIILENAQKISQTLSSGSERVSRVVGSLTSNPMETSSRLGGVISLLTGIAALKSVLDKFKSEEVS